MRLYMAMIIHSARLPRLNHIGFALSRHGIHITGLRYAIIARTPMIHKWMIYTMQMNRMR